ncbi:MAG: Na+/H+ antiporter NhaC family protein [Bacteroidales bacterium]|nr:Na+/H+ antiporter NhaC family protein [Bacteroidales bacterium]
MPSKRPRRNGLLAISPLFVMALAFIVFSLLLGDFSKIPLIIVFILTSTYALVTTRGGTMTERIQLFSKGAGEPNLLLMVWIFVMAGAFAASAKAMGAVDATVDLTLYLLPHEMLLAGIFVAACFISMSIGTSVGTIVALVPVAAGLADKTGIAVPLLVASAVGGAFFGDNLSFISDTTIVATRSQGCEMKDKFRVNVRIVLPAAVLTFLVYVVLGQGNTQPIEIADISLLKVMPYIVVMLTAIMGMDVMLVLFLGVVLTGVVGMATGTYALADWLGAMTEGAASMSELILISMMAGGLLELIRHNGGITYFIHVLTRRVHSKVGAELSIGLLVSLTNLCTANNTVAILSVGRISRDISEKYGVDKCKSASILDTFSCGVQGLIPYGAQILMASGIAAISPLEIIPYLFYPMAMLACAVLAILLRYPRKYS